jgi:jumonji domain-containing protein 7
MIASSTDKAIEELIVSFGELNPGQVEELEEDPSPLEFMRSVARNTPFVIRGGASNWKAMRKWDADYLNAALSGQTVKVAVTPKG